MNLLLLCVDLEFNLTEFLDLNFLLLSSRNKEVLFIVLLAGSVGVAHRVPSIKLGFTISFYLATPALPNVFRDFRVSIETLSVQFNVSVGAVHIIIREELKMRKICAKFVPRVLREDQRERRCNDSKEMVELINSDPQVLDALVTCDESWIYCYDPETKRQSSQWKHAGSPRPKKARQSKSTQKLMMIPFLTAWA